MKKTFLALLMTSLFAVQANAIVEAKLTYTALASNPDFSPLYTGSNSLPTVAPNIGLGADLVVFIPATSWGFGLRYEDLKFSVTSGSLQYKSQATRTGLLVAYRFIDTVFHLGLIGTYGLSHTNSMQVTDSSAGGLSYNWQPDTSTSYSIGLETSLSLATFLLGGEVGYMNMKWNKMRDKTGSSAATPDTDMSGTYAKLFVGFSL